MCNHPGCQIVVTNGEIGPDGPYYQPQGKHYGQYPAAIMLRLCSVYRTASERLNEDLIAVIDPYNFVERMVRSETNCVVVNSSIAVIQNKLQKLERTRKAILTRGLNVLM